jgi:hypothetical protein
MGSTRILIFFSSLSGHLFCWGSREYMRMGRNGIAHSGHSDTRIKWKISRNFPDPPDGGD